MTDLEISKALALTIGYSKYNVRISYLTNHTIVYVDVNDGHCDNGWKVFDYRDWNVIGPIAERYDCFPNKPDGQWASTVGLDSATWVEADTPQKAIAMAVIGATK